MMIKWQGDYWEVKYYDTGYPRYTLERDGITVSWLQNDEQNFNTQKQFLKFLRGKGKTMTDVVLPINDDTVLDTLRWQLFDREGKSYEIAWAKYKAIVAYVFDVYLDQSKFYTVKDGITIRVYASAYSYKGIKLEFYDSFERRTRFRLLKFKGLAKDYKKIVLQKFEMLKKEKEDADSEHAKRELETKAREVEIAELEKRLLNLIIPLK